MSKWRLSLNTRKGEKGTWSSGFDITFTLANVNIRWLCFCYQIHPHYKSAKLNQTRKKTCQTKKSSHLFIYKSKDDKLASTSLSQVKVTTVKPGDKINTWKIKQYLGTISSFTSQFMSTHIVCKWPKESNHQLELARDQTCC